MNDDLVVIMYEGYVCIAELPSAGIEYQEIERFDHSQLQSYVDEWFPTGLDINRIFDRRVPYATGGIVRPGIVPNPVHQYATVKFDGTVR